MRTLIAAFLIVICSPVPCISEPYGFFNFRRAWIKSLGQYGPAVIGVKKGDVVKVDLIGSAAESAFYYSIVETTGNAYIIDASPQVIINRDSWRSITTIGLFRAKADTRLRFRANFIKGDQSGRIRVFGLTLIATVIGSRPMNLALRHYGAKASQSTTAYEGPAQRAIDGNTDGNWHNRSVTHTADELNSYWQVTLPKPAIIEEIVIWNRSDCCGNRLSNLRISVLDDSKEEVWGKKFKGPVDQGGFKEFELDPPKEGRFVKVQILGKNKEGNGHLSLAEVEVFGEFTK